MKYKYFLKNLSILTISNFVGKILLFLMLPLYTNILTSDEYGIIDLITTTTQLAIPIFTLCITEAILRYSIDSSNSKKQVLEISLKVFTKGYMILLPISIISHFILKINIIYILIFNIYYIVSSLSSIFTFYFKGLERIKIIGVASVIKVIVLVSLNCLMLLYFKTGIIGYYFSLIMSELINIIILLIDMKLKPLKLEKNNEEKQLQSEMIDYSKHFVLNSISWWINNASDKYILLLFFNASVTGIYSVSYKIPTIIEFVQNIFAQAWQISAIKEYNDTGAKRFFSNMYNCYNLVLVFTVCFLLIFLKLLAKILFAKEFYIAWMYVPFLLIAILFGALSGFLGSIYAANKDSKMYARSTLVGAIANIILNFALIPKFGSQGAAIATLISYILIWVLRLVFMKKYIVLDIDYFKNLLTYFILIIMSICLITMSTINSLVACVMGFAFILIVNVSYLKSTFIFVKKGLFK